jgi:hypothetical protein
MSPFDPVTNNVFTFYGIGAKFLEIGNTHKRRGLSHYQ